MSTESEQFQYIRATVSDGELTINYRLRMNPSAGRMTHDEDVSEWADKEIKELIAGLIDVPSDELHKIEIEFA